jgi:hypothetical protein
MTVLPRSQRPPLQWQRRLRLGDRMNANLTVRADIVPIGLTD